MNKGLKRLALLSLVCSMIPVSFTSCEDYDDDINNLQEKIDAIKIDVDRLKGMVDAGKTISTVTSSADGVVFTMSDGQTYSITNGKPGTSWTIDDEGYWAKDGVSTEYKAIGVDGAVGPQGPKGDKGDQGAEGPQGGQGTPGKNGEYYVPNASTGFFDIYLDGVKIKDSGISWRTPNENTITAVYSGNTLTISNVEGGEGEAKTVKIQIGAQLGTLAFIPSVLSNVGGYPTTDKPFYNLAAYLSEEKYIAGTWKFEPQTKFDKSNVVGLEYRISPEDAYISTTSFGKFINRVVTTRAAEGDLQSLLNVDSFVPENTSATGVLNVNATFNKTAVAISGNDIAAFQLWNGQVAFTSDYIAPTTTVIDAFIVNPIATKEKKMAVRYYDRTEVINANNKETSDFIKKSVGLSDPANLALTHDDAAGLALLPYVDLYTDSNGLNDFLTALGFSSITYKFSLPDEYLADDDVKTNQQWFVQLEESVLKINTKNLVNGTTPAIGRTPVVRVDAYTTDNSGKNTLMVASSYIKVEIVEKPISQVDKDPVKVQMAERNYNYTQLDSDFTNINTMDYRNVNNEIYGAVGLTSETFWKYYGGDNNIYKVDISVLGANDKPISLAKDETTAGPTPYVFNKDGIKCEVSLDQLNTTSSLIRFGVNNKAKTERTAIYKNVDGKGAQYTVTITIPATNIKQFGNIEITQIFFVKDDIVKYAFNPNYYYGEFNNYSDCVITKGTNKSGSWEFQMNIEEAFRMLDGNTVFEYFNSAQAINYDDKVMNYSNVSDIVFGLVNEPGNRDGVSYDTNTHEIALTEALAKDYKYAKMQYTLTLVNGETKTFPFTIVFQNPFKSGAIKGVEIEDKIGKVVTDTDNRVNVVDLSDKAIYSWSATAQSLVLSAIATNDYKLTDEIVNVEYAFAEDKAYLDFKGQLAPEATFEIDSATGQITYDNLGALLVKSYALTVKATVKFTNISEVTCFIPVDIKAQVIK